MAAEEVDVGVAAVVVIEVGTAAVSMSITSRPPNTGIFNSPLELPAARCVSQGLGGDAIIRCASLSCAHLARLACYEQRSMRDATAPSIISAPAIAQLSHETLW